MDAKDKAFIYDNIKLREGTREGSWEATFTFADGYQVSRIDGDVNTNAKVTKARLKEALYQDLIADPQPSWRGEHKIK